MPGFRFALAAAVALWLAACGADNRRISHGSDEDLRASHDLAAGRDLSVPPDMTEVPDLTDEPDLTPTECSVVGDWDLGQGFVITLDAQGQVLSLGMKFGTYMQSGTTFTIQDDFSPACMMTGKYRLKFGVDCSTVTSTLISDPCMERSDVLNATWRRM